MGILNFLTLSLFYYLAVGELQYSTDSDYSQSFYEANLETESLILSYEENSIPNNGIKIQHMRGLQNKNLNAQAHIGLYVPNTYAYEKLYMGKDKLGVTGLINSYSGDAKKTYKYTATDLESIAPQATHIYYNGWVVDKTCIVKDPDTVASWAKTQKLVHPEVTKNPKGCYGMLNDLMSLKTKFPHLKLILTIGEEKDSKHMSQCAATAKGTQAIVDSALYLLKQIDNNFGTNLAIWNGLNFQWIDPENDNTENSITAKDYENYMNLIVNLKSKAAQQALDIIVTAEQGLGEHLNKLIQNKPPNFIKAYCDIVDHLNIKAYGFSTKADSVTGYYANFCTDNNRNNPHKYLSVKDNMEKLIDSGCNASKLVMGIPTYVEAKTKVPGGKFGTGLYSSIYVKNPEDKYGWSTFSQNNNAYNSTGYVNYFDILDTIKADKTFFLATKVCPKSLDIKVPVKHVYSFQYQAFASYEDSQTVQAKTEWAKKMGMKGVYFSNAFADPNADLVKASVAAWKTHTPSLGTQIEKCYDNAQPEQDVYPTNKYDGCTKAGHILTVPMYKNNCKDILELAKQKCKDNYKPKFLGSEKYWDKDYCYKPCSADWKETGIYINNYETVYYKCVSDPDF